MSFSPSPFGVNALGILSMPSLKVSIVEVSVAMQLNSFLTSIIYFCEFAGFATGSRQLKQLRLEAGDQLIDDTVPPLTVADN